MPQRRRNPIPPQRPSLARSAGQVCIAFIHPGQTSAYFTESLVATLLYDRGKHVGGLLQEWSSANVSSSRNSLTRRFLDTQPNCDWLLWIDADMRWTHTAVEELLASADPKDRPVVGGLCFGSNDQTGLFPTIYQIIEQLGTLKTVRVTDYPRDAVYHCSATGAAFLLIHRTVLEAMAKRQYNQAFPFFQETEMSGMPCGEDITFCLRVGLLGYPVHVNTAVRIGHHKSHLLTEELFDTQHSQEVSA